jgi:diguanylate cyclase (GGDEF)-like protein/PAS domain S-box-containing protein
VNFRCNPGVFVGSLRIVTPLVFSLLPAFAAVSSLWLAVAIWLRRPSPPAISLGLYLFSVAVWSFGYCFQLRSVDLAGQVFWSKIEYLGPAGVSLAGLIFVLQYAGIYKWVTARRILLLAIIPLMTQVLVWTNGMHGWIWRRIWLDTSGSYPTMGREHGPWFWVFLVYGYGLCFISIILLARVLLRGRGIYRKQAAILLLGCVVPFIGNILYSFDARPLANYDLTVFCFSITGLSMAWGLYRFRLSVIMPAAHEMVVEGMSDGLIVLEPSGSLVDVNREAAAIFGYPASMLVGRLGVNAFQHHPEFAQLCSAPVDARVELDIDRGGECRRFDVKCSTLRNRRGRPNGHLIMLRDISELKAAEMQLRAAHTILEQRVAERTTDLSRTIQELQAAQEQLWFTACHDSLTDLPNRTLFLDRLSTCLRASSTGSSISCAVVYIDVDRFKVYNDGYGHHVGDLILIEIGSRLKQCFQERGMVARMGGDEFTVLVETFGSVDEISEMAERCRLEIARPAQIDWRDVHLTVSLGIAFGSPENESPEELVRDADLAMYRAKRLGGNRSVLFGESLRTSAVSLLQLEQDLRLAIQRRELLVHYQPFVNLKDHRVVGFEALVRWRHPVRGLLLPSEFLQAAEQTGIIMPIDEFVLSEVCRQKDLWNRTGRFRTAPLFVTVNISGWQFSHSQRWWEMVNDLGEQTDGIRLEMMESVLIANAHAAAEFFEETRARKLQIYLDDFGTGYSSLSWLSHFPIRTLKIDRSFVQGLVNGGPDLSIVRAIVALARSLEIEVVAEGIESEEQCSILRELGCGYGQGFYFSPPLDDRKALEMVRLTERNYRYPNALAALHA